MIRKKILPTNCFEILRIDLEMEFGRMWRGPDIARFRLEKSIGSAFLRVFLELGDLFVGNILFRNMT